MYSIRAELDAELGGNADRRETALSSPQGAHIRVGDRELVNFCSNNYLGLADHPDVVDAAGRALRTHGFGMAAVRFVCGTQTVHHDLEDELTRFLGTGATLLLNSCFDANAGLFEVLLDERDAVLSDELNHASIIDGIRLCRATRLRYRHGDVDDLAGRLRACAGARRRLIVTDGVFSMDGSTAPLAEICDLADRHDALVVVDDSHAVGVLGDTGAGTPQAAGVQQRIDAVTGTLGKALGGAAGGYVSGRAEIVELLRRRARPYVFSNALPPVVVAGSLAALGIAVRAPELRERLHANAASFREQMVAHGFDVLPGRGPVAAVLFGDDQVAEQVAEVMVAGGVHVVAFTHPVVPRGTARIRVQLTAAHTGGDVDRCVRAFVEARGRIRGRDAGRSGAEQQS